MALVEEHGFDLVRSIFILLFIEFVLSITNKYIDMVV